MRAPRVRQLPLGLTGALLAAALGGPRSGEAAPEAAPAALTVVVDLVAEDAAIARLASCGGKDAVIAATRPR